MSEQTPIKLRIPHQDLAEFSLFPVTAEGAREWARLLPVANTRQSVAQLREAVRELNRVEIDPYLRFQVMEALGPCMQVAVTNLARRFLNQPLVLPEEPRQLAELAENLHSAFSTAYTLVAVHTIQRRGGEEGTNPARLTCESLQRAILYAGRRMLQTFQLYQQVEPRGWLTLHQLYALGERQNLALLPVRDPAGHQATLQNTYLQALLMGCCKANQLRQSDLTGIYLALGKWSRRVPLLDADAGQEGLFSVDLSSDHPPMYNAGGLRHGPQHRYLDTRELVTHLVSLRETDRANGRRGIKLDESVTLPSNLLDHLIASLGSHSQRNFSRVGGGDTELEVAVGLASAHYHAAEGKAFAELLPAYLGPDARQADNPFGTRNPQAAPWLEQARGGAGATNGHLGNAGQAPEPVSPGSPETLDAHTSTCTNINTSTDASRYPVHRTRAINSSPGGYCLEWSGEPPTNLRSGDIVCVREPGQPEWVIAAVRWISALEQAQTLVGVEFLSPRAMPYGARLVGQRGALSEPIRVLLLPEIKLVGKPHTLITPRTGFRERQKVVLLREEEEFLIQLQRQIGAAAGYSQFDFRYIRELERHSSVAAEEVEAPRPAFDSLWSKI